MKNLIKQNGDKFIVIENGEPEMVVMSYQEYERLVKGDPSIRITSELSQYHSDDRLVSFGSRQEFQGAEFVAPVVARPVGLSLRLEDIRPEDLPI